ncbi:hypothetical protein B0O99DRAFT_601048 [Bisporella sp. PMI_857]|nr:hypothetical protein B0O99DRAFT_601048 [Bisporella sp. PMI_857]
MPLQKFADPFSPCFMFFYGSLMDPDVLQSVLGLSDVPRLRKGTIKGFRMKMWGIYPAILDDQEGEVTGMIWKCDQESHFLRLQGYETKAYTWTYCDVNLEDGGILGLCRTFCWAGDVNSKDLDDGSFDLLRYQKYFKASIVRK